MGEFLMHWIENKLGLHLPFFQDPQKFRKAMSNGYLIGEILRKYNVISDDQCISLKKTLSNKCSVKNMQYIHKWLRDNGLSTDFQELLAIVEEEPGAAVRFIYRLYLWLESPKGFTIAGFKAMPNLQKYLRQTAIGEEDTSCCVKPKPVKIEFKPWETLADRNKQAMEAGDGVEFASEMKQHIYYDVPLQPPVLLNVKPFSGPNPNEGSDTEDLYYDVRSKRKSQQNDDADNPENDWKKQIQQPVTICSFRSRSKTAKKKSCLPKEPLNPEEMKSSMNEMKQFNEVVQHTLDKQPAVVKVYENGLGDPDDYKRSLLEMKKKLLDEQKLSNERESYRKSLTCKIQTTLAEESSKKLDEEILRKLSNLPTREKNLAEFISWVHQLKQCFVDHKIFEENQLAEYRSMDNLKEMSLIDQKEILRRCLAKKDIDFKTCVESETTRAQQAALSNKVLTDVSGILDNLLDLVIKIATFRDTAQTDPPDALLEEWKEEFHQADAAQEANEASARGESMSMLDDIRVKDYLFREGSWNVEVPTAGDFTENYVLKKIATYILEGLYPPPIPDPTLPSPDFVGAVAVSGVNFQWKPSRVREALQNVAKPFSLDLHILDVTLLVQEAVKAYSSVLTMSAAAAVMNSNFNMYTAYPGEVEGEEFQTLWCRSVRPEIELANTEEEETDVSEVAPVPESVVTFGPILPQDEEIPTTINPENKELKRKKSQVAFPGDTRKISQTHKSIANPSDNEEIKSGAVSPSNRPFPENDNEITEKSLEESFAKKRRRSGKKSKDSQYYSEPPEHSQVYEIVRDSLRPTVDAWTEDDLQILFDPHDQPETWPEFAKLGRLALDQLLTGYPVTDSLVSKIVAERMRHYPANSYVIILNYPQAMCQAVYLEDTIRENDLPRPPCYHHVDDLIMEFKKLRNEEVGPLLRSAGKHFGNNKSQHESLLFKHNNEDHKAGVARRDGESQREGATELLFRSFLDAVIIADINHEQLRDPRVINNLDDAQQRMINKEDASVEEKLDVLRHIAYLQFKKFYGDQGLAYILDLGIPSEPYYLALKELLQQILGLKYNHRRGYEYAGEAALPEDNGLQGNKSEEDEALTTPTIDPSEEESEMTESQNTKEEMAPTGKKKKGKGKDKGSKEKGKKEKKSKEKKSKKKKGGGSKTKVGKKEKGGKKSKKKGGGTTSEEEEWSAEEEMQNTEPLPEVVPGNPPTIYYNIKPEDMAVLGNFWTNMEERYVRGIRDALNEIRHSHDRVAMFADQFRSNLKDFLERPDNKQSLLAQFQERFNQVSGYIRGDYEVKAELHNRVSELRERLSAICDERHDEAVQEVFSILSQGYLEGEIEILTNLFITLIQLEADHYCDVIQFINDFYCMSGLVKPETLPWCDVLRIELVSRSKFASRQFSQSRNEGEEDEEEDFQMNTLSQMLNTNMFTSDRGISSSMQGEPSRAPSKNFKDSSAISPRGSKRLSKRSKSLVSPVPLKQQPVKSKRSTIEKIMVPETPIELLGESADETNFAPLMNENADSAPPATRLLEGYFGDDEANAEQKAQKSFKENVESNHEISLDFLQSVLSRVFQNVNKVETFTMNYVRNAASTFVPDGSEKTTPEVSTSKDHPTNSNVSLKASKSRSKGKKKKDKEGGKKKKGKSKSKSQESVSGKKKKAKKTKSKSQESLSEKGKKAKKTKSKSQESLSEKGKKAKKTKSKSQESLSEKGKKAKKTKSKSKESSPDGEKKGKKKKGKDKQSGSEDEKGKKKGKKNKGKKGKSPTSKDAISTVKLPLMSSPPQVPHNTPVNKKEKGTKRTAEWQLAIELEGKRIRIQLAVIEQKAKQELQQLRDWLLQIISVGEKDAALAYKAEIQNVRAVCDLFRFAIENGTPVDTDLILEKAQFLIGCQTDINVDPAQCRTYSGEQEYDQLRSSYQSEYFTEEE